MREKKGEEKGARKKVSEGEKGGRGVGERWCEEEWRERGREKECVCVCERESDGREVTHQQPVTSKGQA